MKNCKKCARINEQTSGLPTDRTGTVKAPFLSRRKGILVNFSAEATELRFICRD